jgi:hypothetical protein
MENIRFDNTRKIRVTPQWMKYVFNVLNEWLFNNELLPCELQVSKDKEFANGDMLGFFNFLNEGSYDSKTRRLVITDYDGKKKYVTSFQQLVEHLHPVIAMNGNYTATEYALASTLVHEMCHYYVIKSLCWPAKAHGAEFRRVGRMVEMKSNGYFKIDTRANDEEMANYELDKEIQNKNEEKKKRLFLNKARRLTAIFIFRQDGEIHLTPTTLASVKQNVVDMAERHPEQIKAVIFVNNLDLSTWILSYGYKPIRTLGHYNVTDIYPNEEYIRSHYGGRVAWRNEWVKNENMKSNKKLVDEAVDKAINRFIMREFHENRDDNDDVVVDDNNIVTIPTDVNLSIENV